MFGGAAAASVESGFRFFTSAQRNLQADADHAYCASVELIETPDAHTAAMRANPTYTPLMSKTRKSLVTLFREELVSSFATHLDQVAIGAPMIAVHRLSLAELASLVWLRAASVDLVPSIQVDINADAKVDDFVHAYQGHPWGFLYRVATSDLIPTDVKQRFIEREQVSGLPRGASEIMHTRNFVLAAMLMPTMAGETSYRSQEHTVDRLADGSTWVSMSSDLLREIQRTPRVRDIQLRDRHGVPFTISEMVVHLSYFVGEDTSQAKPYAGLNVVADAHVASVIAAVRFLDQFHSIWPKAAEDLTIEVGQRIGDTILTPEVLDLAKKYITRVAMRPPAWTSKEDRRNLYHLALNIFMALASALGLARVDDLKYLSANGRTIIDYLATHRTTI
jgi:hypothetical protein